MRYLGIDYGARRLGIAVSDEAGAFAFPKETMPNDVSTIDRIARIVRDEGIKEIVMGDTRSPEGKENSITAESDAFAKALAAHLTIEVHREREAWTTQEAARFAPKGKAHDDAAAAAIMLQRFLETAGNKK